MTSKTTNKYAPEVRERAVRMVLDQERDHASRWAAVVSAAAKIGCAAQLKALERENHELRQANEILRKPVLSLSKGRAHILRRRSEPKTLGARSSDDRVQR